MNPSFLQAVAALLCCVALAAKPALVQADNAQEAATPALPAGAKAKKSDASFTISGAVAKPGEWTVERLSKEFAADIKMVEYTLKGHKGQARCIPLLAVLKATELRLNPKVKNHLLAFVAFVRAEDGYTVSFSLGELQPEVGKREVWIALDRDGHPIPDVDGPVEILVITDEKPARWVHSVSRIVLIDGITATEKF